MSKLEALKIKIFADGADLKGILALAKDPMVKGFTTNPSLMRKDGITDYETFACTLLKAVPDMPISFEVFADDLKAMEAQANRIASWGSNVYVKVPVTNTKGEFTGPLLTKLSRGGIALNVTAILTLEQVAKVTDALDANTPAVVSVFAGRPYANEMPLVRPYILIMHKDIEDQLDDLLWSELLLIHNRKMRPHTQTFQHLLRVHTPRHAQFLEH